MGMLHLVHDVLDAQLLDRRGDKIGRVDGLTLELRPGAPPRVAAVLIGGPVRAARIGRPAVWLGDAMRAIARVKHSGMSRVAFERVTRIGTAVALDVDGSTLEAGHLERWLAEHLIERIPGAGDEEQRK
jgi:hypothetical protein